MRAEALSTRLRVSAVVGGTGAHGSLLRRGQLAERVADPTVEWMMLQMQQSERKRRGRILRQLSAASTLQHVDQWFMDAAFGNNDKHGSRS